MDSLRHPDLVQLAQSMRTTFDLVLDAEHAAAEVAHRRTRELRELLLELEDRASTVRLVASGREIGPAPLSAVGHDHILLRAGERPMIVPLWSIDLVEVVA